WLRSNRRNILNVERDRSQPTRDHIDSLSFHFRFVGFVFELKGVGRQEAVTAGMWLSTEPQARGVCELSRSTGCWIQRGYLFGKSRSKHSSNLKGVLSFVSFTV